MIALMKKPNTHGIKHILYDTLNMIQVKPKKIAEWICKENLSNRNYATLHYFKPGIRLTGCWIHQKRRSKETRNRTVSTKDTMVLHPLIV